MGKVDQIMQGKTFTVEIDGVEFVLWKLTAKMALRALGSKLFGMVSAASRDKGGKELTPEQQAEIVRGYLREAMISPRCGDITDASADVISFDDLDKAGLADRLFMELMNSAEGGDTDFTETSSEAEMEAG